MYFTVFSKLDRFTLFMVLNTRVGLFPDIRRMLFGNFTEILEKYKHRDSQPGDEWAHLGMKLSTSGSSRRGIPNAFSAISSAIARFSYCKNIPNQVSANGRCWSIGGLYRRSSSGWDTFRKLMKTSNCKKYVVPWSYACWYAMTDGMHSYAIYTN